MLVEILQYHTYFATYLQFSIDYRVTNNLLNKRPSLIMYVVDILDKEYRLRFNVSMPLWVYSKLLFRQNNV